MARDVLVAFLGAGLLLQLAVDADDIVLVLHQGGQLPEGAAQQRVATSLLSPPASARPEGVWPHFPRCVDKAVQDSPDPISDNALVNGMASAVNRHASNDVNE